MALNPRDSIKDAEYWTAYVPDQRSFIKEIKQDLKETDQSAKQKLGDAYDLQRHAYNYGCALYSAGAPLSEVCEAFRFVLTEAYPQFVAMCQDHPDLAQGYSGGWDVRYKYISLAILLNLPSEDNRPLLNALAFWQEPDLGMERMITEMCREARDNYILNANAKMLLWPDDYASLNQALAPHISRVEQTGHLEEFLKNWLKEMRKSTNPAYNNHNNRHNIYFGYWCWEAAAVAVIMDVEDSAIKSHKHYPNDMVLRARHERGLL